MDTDNYIKNFNFEKFSDEVAQAIKDKKPLLGAEGIFTPFLKNILERSLSSELNAHLEAPKTNLLSSAHNRKNGKTSKTMQSSFGDFELITPRDRNGTFDPQTVKKRQTVLNPELDEKILRLFGCGMSYADIVANIKELYGIDVSDSTIHAITEQILPVITEWRSRPLESTYAIVFLDAMFFKARENGKVVHKAMYNLMGINLDGQKDILGFYLSDTEGAHFWLSVLNDLKARGVNDILIACIDGLKGFPEAIASAYPKTEVQLCIVHQIRNSLKYVGSSNQKEFMRDLKRVYQAPNAEVAFQNLSLLDEKWGQKYSLAVKPWFNHWDQISYYFKFSPDIRKLIYTTNAIEGLHRQIRKYTKTKGAFTSETALIKLVYCVIQNAQKKWATIRNWASILSQLDIFFPSRVVMN